MAEQPQPDKPPCNNCAELGLKECPDHVVSIRGTIDRSALIMSRSDEQLSEASAVVANSMDKEEREKSREVAMVSAYFGKKRKRFQLGVYVINPTRVPGIIRVCLGPMFSGKSSWLGRHATRAMHGPKRNSLLVMPAANGRDPPTGISTHDKVIVAMKILQVESLAQALLDEKEELMSAHEVFVEETQFVPYELGWACEQLALMGKNLYVTVLTSTYKRDLWDGTRTLIKVADQVEHLTAICLCGAEAPFSSKIRPGPAAVLDTDGSNTRIDTGAEEKYVAHCRICYLKHRALTLGDVRVVYD